MSALTDKDPMPFGTHKDACMEDVPAGYLLYFYSDRKEWLKIKYYNVYLYIKKNLKSIQMDAEEEETRFDYYACGFDPNWD